MTPGLVPMLSPDGQSGDIPAERVQDAIKAGFKPAVVMTSPDGRMGYIPRDRANDALKAGFKIGQPATSIEKPGAPSGYGFTPANLARNVGRGLIELGKGGVQMLSDVGGAILPQKLGGDPITDTALMHHIVDPMEAEAAKARAAEAAGQPYVGHAIASGIPVIGPYAANLGEQAATGDVGGALARGATQYAAPKLAGDAATLATKAAGRAALLGKTPEAAYESALKPSTTLSEAERTAAVKTGIENEIPVSKGGLDKISGLIDDLNQKVKETIASDPTKQINPANATKNLSSLRSKFANQVNPAADLNAIDQAKQEFLGQFRQPNTAYRVRDVGEQGVPLRNSHSQATMSADEANNYVESRGSINGKPQEISHIDLTKLDPGDYTLMDGPNGSKWVKFSKPLPESAIVKVGPTEAPMSVADAQAMKQGTYRALGSKSYGELKGASVEAQKSLARGLKDEIAAQFPELKNLNASEGKLLDLQPILERAVARNANHQIIGIGTPIAAGAGKAISGSSTVGAVVGTMKAVLDNPMVKSRLAIMVSKGAKIPIGQAMARVQAYSTSLGSYAAAQGSVSNGDTGASPTTPQP